MRTQMTKYSVLQLILRHIHTSRDKCPRPVEILLWFMGKSTPGIRPYTRKAGQTEQLGRGAGSNGKFNRLICSLFRMFSLTCEPTTDQLKCGGFGEK